VRTITTKKETVEFLSQQRDKGLTIGFVPTMGALHQGHLELMKRAKLENDLLVVSIFVNPIQFNNKEDLRKYPRDIDKDKKLLLSVGCDILFSPGVEEMYPSGEQQKVYDFGDLEKVMEGASRPGHFNGVGVVVSKLFNICIPHKAYFGEKDFQQLAIINKLVEIENIPVTIVPCPIVREEDGLAMSSRNQRLTKTEREVAPFIYEVLRKARDAKELLCAGHMKQFVINQFEAREEFDLEYFEIADDKDLQPIDHFNDSIGTIGFIAVNLGNIRLIDNIRII
jgi:pantoate--beta-alanine ligase